MNLEELQRYLDVEEDETLEPSAPVDLVPRLVKSENKAAPVSPVDSSQEPVISLQDIEMALKLGYLLCKCTWPPQIMVLTGTDHVYRCKRCSRVRDV
ncbi:MAG: hypothetical protein R3332_01060 [Pseudohongiellaceae bacterium]|nr:hypothetical protein [Pseudohongiellaceae bacterium]